MKGKTIIIVVALALVGPGVAAAKGPKPDRQQGKAQVGHEWEATMSVRPENADTADLAEVPDAVLLESYGSTAPLLTTQAQPVSSAADAEADASNGGCWRGYIENGQDTATGSYFLRFNPLWCGNGYSVTYQDADWFYQTCDGWYSCDGTSGPFHVNGCVGCDMTSWTGFGQFAWHVWFGYDSNHPLRVGARLYGYCGYIELW